MSIDKKEIEQTVQVYFDSMFESDIEKVNTAFHPNAMISGNFGGSFSEMNREDFGKFVASQQPTPKEKGDTPRLEILSIEIAGDTAVARVRDDYLGKTFLDTLSMVKLEGNWSIYNKLYHIEGETQLVFNQL